MPEDVESVDDCSGAARIGRLRRLRRLCVRRIDPRAHVFFFFSCMTVTCDVFCPSFEIYHALGQETQVVSDFLP